MWQREAVGVVMWKKLGSLSLEISPADGIPSKFELHCECMGIRKKFSMKNVTFFSPS